VAFQSGERIYGRVDTRELNDTALPHEVFVEKVTFTFHALLFLLEIVYT